MLDEWHSLPEVFDNELDAQIHRWYANPPQVWPKRPYFSPSSANDCPRELYLKAKRAKRDEFRRPPHQARWQRIGTSIGDVIQRDLLFIEKHFEEKTGNVHRFRFERNPDGTPRCEDFAKTNKRVDHAGETFYLYVAPDGVMMYISYDGDPVRVGLEIESKQTAPSRTSLYSMRAPDESHVKQVVSYAHMYDYDYGLIVYVNVAKQGWNMDDERYEKTPDVRAFCVKVGNEEKAELFGRLAEITKSIRVGEPLPLDLDRFTFNNYKKACSLDLSEDEYERLQKKLRVITHSNIPNWKKERYVESFEFIKRVREGGEVGWE